MSDAISKAKDQIEIHRASIDRLDTILINTLAERFRHTQAVGKLKVTYDFPIVSVKREEDQLVRIKKLAQEAGLESKFAAKFLRFIIDEVVENHRKTPKIDQGEN